mgnify:CR=1
MGDVQLRRWLFAVLPALTARSEHTCNVDTHQLCLPTQPINCPEDDGMCQLKVMEISLQKIFCWCLSKCVLFSRFLTCFRTTPVEADGPLHKHPLQTTS